MLCVRKQGQKAHSASKFVWLNIWTPFAFVFIMGTLCGCSGFIFLSCTRFFTSQIDIWSRITLRLNRFTVMCRSKHLWPLSNTFLACYCKVQLQSSYAMQLPGTTLTLCATLSQRKEISQHGSQQSHTWLYFVLLAFSRILLSILQYCVWDVTRRH